MVVCNVRMCAIWILNLHLEYYFVHCMILFCFSCCCSADVFNFFLHHFSYSKFPLFLLVSFANLHTDPQHVVSHDLIILKFLRFLFFFLMEVLSFLKEIDSQDLIGNAASYHVRAYFGRKCKAFSSHLAPIVLFSTCRRIVLLQN